MNMKNRLVQILILLVAYGSASAWAETKINEIKGPITAAKVFTQTAIKSKGKDDLEKIVLRGPWMDYEKYGSYSVHAVGSFQQCYDSSFSDIQLTAVGVDADDEWRFFDKAEIEGKNYAILPDTYRSLSPKSETVDINLSVEDLKRLAEKELFNVNVSGKWGTKTITLHGAYVEGFLKVINQCAVLYKNRPKE